MMGDDGPQVEPVPRFATSIPAGSTEPMVFDITYTNATQIPQLLAHAITLGMPDGGPSTPALIKPGPVGCEPLAVLHPSLVREGWTAFFGCCRIVQDDVAFLFDRLARQQTRRSSNT